MIGRQVILDAQQREFSRAQQQIAGASGELSAVESSPNANGGQQALAQARATLAEMDAQLTAHQDAAALTTQVKALLDVVDGMEQLYG